MSKTIIKETPHFALYFHPELKIVHLELHKFITGESFRQALTEGLELLRKESAKKWLSDGRHGGVLSAEDADWGLNVWAPQIVAAGWKFWALVLPEMLIGQLNMKRFAKAYSDKGITVKMFADPDEALKWLEEIN